ncbi:hypothetical protein PMIN01_09437 [Paraphaeosphaeria minitans]|uniref:Uncharacterized protein n=1 Tax=Paraphaeosphaeria minitans TaxID=565426 RepID=A0A9P6KNH8_9PLEO|nr:hypothetical protein PMIN01_09437 [Paraphaeosphaeria minitans]
MNADGELYDYIRETTSYYSRGTYSPSAGATICHQDCHGLHTPGEHYVTVCVALLDLIILLKLHSTNDSSSGWFLRPAFDVIAKIGGHSQQVPVYIGFQFGVDVATLEVETNWVISIGRGHRAALFAAGACVGKVTDGGFAFEPESVDAAAAHRRQSHDYRSAGDWVEFDLSENHGL